MGSENSKIPERNVEAEASVKIEAIADSIKRARAEFTLYWLESVDSGSWKDSGCQMSACLNRCDEIARAVSQMVNEPEYTGEWKGMSFQPIYYRLEMEARQAYKARRNAYLNSLSAEKLASMFLPEWRKQMRSIARNAAYKAELLQWVGVA